MKKSFFLMVVFGMMVFMPVFGQDSITNAGKVKYAFLFIGDGMGQAQINLTEVYLSTTKGKEGMTRLHFTGFPHSGFVTTYAANRLITCSAAAGTALASGHKTNINRVGMDTSGTVRLNSIAEKAKRSGLKVAIITSVSLDHATPASFYAHQPDRNMFFEIGWDLLISDFDYFAGGGFLKPTGTYRDKEVNLLENAKSKDYTICSTVVDFKALKPGKKAIVLAPNPAAEASLPYDIDRPVQEPSLAALTGKGIEMIKNNKGFFMMIEGGKIDWAAHSNDAGTVVHEVIAFDQAIAEALEFYREHPKETIIIVTADHETGGLSLGNRFGEYDSRLELLRNQKVSYEAFHKTVKMYMERKSDNFDGDFSRIMKRAETDFGLDSKEFKTQLSDEEMAALKEAFRKTVLNQQESESTYGTEDPFTMALISLLNEKAGIGWTTSAHTGVNVPLYAIGMGAENFRGTLDNTKIPKILEQLMELK